MALSATQQNYPKFFNAIKTTVSSNHQQPHTKQAKGQIIPIEEIVEKAWIKAMNCADWNHARYLVKFSTYLWTMMRGGGQCPF
jgi:hypothetical protein